MSERVEVNDSLSPSGASRDGYTTSPVTDYGLASGIRDHAREVWKASHERGVDLFETWWNCMEAALGDQPPLLTIHSCWSGYSEYTITNMWSEVSYRLGEVEQHFTSVALFLGSIADAAGRVEERNQMKWMREMAGER